MFKLTLKKECFDEKCTFVHVKGTQRKNFKANGSKIETESDKKIKAFLEIIQNLKKDIMELMDIKIRQSQQLNPQK